MSEQYQLSKYLAATYRLSKNDFNQQLAGLDVRATESDLLLFILDHPERSQREIALEMVIDPSLLARDLRDLAQRQLVTRISDAKDKRIKRITLTAAGVTLARQLQNVMDTWWTGFFNAHPEVDQTSFTTQLKLVYQSLTSFPSSKEF